VAKQPQKNHPCFTADLEVIGSPPGAVPAGPG